MLLVDNNEEDIRYLLQALLEGHGHITTVVSNGAEALERLQTGGIDLIISDIRLPGMDGFQLCRRFKTDALLHNIPLISYTATYTATQDRDFALQIGADLFLEKPCEPERLLAEAEQLLKTGSKTSANNQPLPPEEAFKLYSERLVCKLEQKMIQTEKGIASRRIIEKALRESEARFRLFADTAPVGVVIADYHNKAFYASRKFTALFGYTLADIPDLDTWFHLAYPTPNCATVCVNARQGILKPGVYFIQKPFGIKKAALKKTQVMQDTHSD